MELLLNVVWLSLALLTFGLWWRKTVFGRERCCLDHLFQLILLACVLVLLFPVVSATDDLHPLRPEMEECNPSKRLKQVAAEKSSSTLSAAGALPAQLTASIPTFPLKNVAGQILFEQVLTPESAQLRTDACRAPPVPSLS